MTKKECEDAYIDFSLVKMDHNPKPLLVDKEWERQNFLQKFLGIDTPVEKYKMMLNEGWEAFGRNLYNHQKASRN